MLSCFRPVGGCFFGKWVLSCCACSSIKKPVFCDTFVRSESGYRSPIVVLFACRSKKSLLAKIKQREIGELLAPAPPLPLLGGFLRLFLAGCLFLFIGSGFGFLCSGFKSGGMVWCSQNIKLYVKLYKGAKICSL